MKAIVVDFLNLLNRESYRHSLALCMCMCVCVCVCVGPRKASYTNTTAMGECYITNNKRGVYVKDKAKGKMRIVRNKTTWQNKEK